MSLARFFRRTAIKAHAIFSFLTIIAVVDYSFAQWTNYSSSHFYISAITNNGTSVWLGTSDAGLYRLDKRSKTVTRYHTGNSDLTDDYIWSICRTQEDTVFVGTFFGGLLRFDGTQWTRIPGLSDNDIRSVAVDRQGTIWVDAWNSGLFKYQNNAWALMQGTLSGLITADPALNRIFTVGTPQCNSSACANGGIAVYIDGALYTFASIANQWNQGTSLNAIASNNKGYCWIGTSEGLLRYSSVEGSLSRITSDSAPLPSTNIQALSTDINDGIWIAAGDYSGSRALVYGSPQKPGWTRYDSSNSKIPAASFSKICSDLQNGVWLGLTSGAIAHFSADACTTFQLGNSLVPGNTITALAMGQDSTVWIGGNYGLAYFRSNKIDTAGSLFNKPVSALAIGKNGGLLIGVQQPIWASAIYGGVYTLDGKSFPNHLVSPTSMSVDDSGIVWIGSINYTGSEILNIDNDSLPPRSIPIPSNLQSSLAQVVLADHNGSIWAGTNKSLFRLKNNVWNEVTLTANGLAFGGVYAACTDKNGNVFFGADGGLLRYTADSLIGIGRPPSINPTDTIKALAIDSSGIVWAGTTGGLAAYTGGGWVAYTTKNSSLTSNKITALTIDVLDRKWIGTRLGGLCVLTGKPAVAIISKRTEKSSHAPYGIKRTLQFNQFPVSGQLTSNRFYDAAGRRIQTRQNQNKGKFHSASGIYFSEPASEAR